MISSFLQFFEFSLRLFDFTRRGLHRLFHEMMEENKTALVPRDKEDAVTQRTQFPQVATNMFDVRFSEACPFAAQSFDVVIYFVEFDAAVFVLACGEFIKILNYGTPSLLVTVK